MKTSTTIWVTIAVLIAVFGGWYLILGAGYSSPVQSSQAQVYSSQQASNPANQIQPSVIPATTNIESNTTIVKPKPTGTSSSQSSTKTNSVTPAPFVPLSQSFKINGNDNSADLTNIMIPKGTPVAITFGVDSNNTYHGGLDFRSLVVNTGTIAPGSTKTINFVADQSFSFTPYWPSTNIAKPYTINITVR